MMYRIQGLPAQLFAPLFSLTDAELAARGAVRRTALGPGFPCRISLTDAMPGDPVILTHFEHHPVATPYRASHAIYVRRGEQQYDEVDQVPELRQFSGPRRVELVDTLIAAAVGCGLPVERPEATMIMVCGAAATQVAVLSLGSIVTARSAADWT